jgi:hypothetical protein
MSKGVTPFCSSPVVHHYTSINTTSIFSLDVIESDCAGGEALLLPMYEKFLIGSKVCEKVLVNTEDQLKTLAQVALTHPMSLQKLREVRNECCILSKLVQRGDRHEMRELINTCLKVN